MSGRHGKHSARPDEARPDDGRADDGRAVAVATLPEPRPSVDLSPALAPSIIPGASGRRGARERRREQRRRRNRFIAIGVIVALVAGLVGYVFSRGGGGGSGDDGGTATGGRTQSTVLLEVTGAGGTAVESALLAFDSASGEGTVILVPSQVVADVPGLGAMAFGDALRLGGLDTSRDTLADLLGVTIDGSWSLNAKGFAALVDAVGGVTVPVDADVVATQADGSAKILVPAGSQALAGTSAYQFATYRANGEVEQARLSRLGTVLTAVLAKLPDSQQALAALGKLGSGSKFSLLPAKLAGVLAGIKTANADGDLRMQVLPVRATDAGGTDKALLLDLAATRDLINTRLAGSVQPNRAAGGNVVLVENLVGTPGIGATTRDKLIDAGFVYRPGPNAYGFPNPAAASTVLIYGTDAATVAKGNKVAAALGLPATALRHSTDTQSVADIVVIIGKDYQP